MGFSWIEVEGVDILYVDYRNLSTSDEMIDLLHLTIQEEVANPGLLELADFRGVKVPLAYVDEVTRAGERHRNKFVKKCAVIGIDGVKKFMYRTYCKISGDKSTRACNSESEAIEWLLNDDPASGGNPLFMAQTKDLVE